MTSLSEHMGLPRCLRGEESPCPAQERQDPSLVGEDPLEEEMTHSRIPACRIPWTEEPGRPHSWDRRR